MQANKWPLLELSRIIQMLSIVTYFPGCKNHLKQRTFNVFVDYVEYIIREYPGDSLSQIFSKGLHLKLYLLADNDSCGVERTPRKVVRVTQH